LPVSSPIADLTYRTYDGPLADTKYRWWVIAKYTMLTSLKKKSLWVATAFSAWYYIAMIFVLYFIDQFGKSTRAGQPSFFDTYIQRIVWKDQFLIGFSYGQIMFLIIGLIIGAGAIANDNRANALLVYLSKPCTKLDYLMGKWFGVFLPLFTVMVIPAFFFYMYGALTFRNYGFFYQDPWVFPKLLLMCLFGATLHASLLIGFSSMFKQGRIAGATYAGLYFLSNFFTQMMAITWMMGQGGFRRHNGGGAVEHFQNTLVSNLYYASVDGINIGMAKAVLHTDGSAQFGSPSPIQMVPAPSIFGIMVILLGLSAISLFVAWTRIRAVEIV
jgi:ABC-2 type transport system permease protein